MTPRRVYYINYLDPKTGFLEREEFDSHRDRDTRVAELRKASVTRITEGSFETG